MTQPLDRGQRGRLLQALIRRYGAGLAGYAYAKPRLEPASGETIYRITDRESGAWTEGYFHPRGRLIVTAEGEPTK